VNSRCASDQKRGRRGREQKSKSRQNVSQVDDRQPIAFVRGRRGAYEADIKGVARCDANMYKELEPNKNPAKDAKRKNEN